MKSISKSFQGKCFFLIGMLATAAVSQASMVTLGYASFDLDNPVNGQSSFTINNFSGPSLGCTVDFQICDNVAITSAMLSITYLDAASLQHSLTRSFTSPILPGTTTPVNFIFNSVSVNITAAELTGTIAPLTFSLNDNSIFTAAPAFDSVFDLVNGNTSLIQITSPVSTTVPEPAPFALLSISLLFLMKRRS